MASMASQENLVVAYHDGGQLFAGDPADYPAGWYLFDGTDVTSVTVKTPGGNDPLGVCPDCGRISGCGARRET